MSGSEYTLTGFDYFLERRRVVFVKPLPSTRVCSVCGVVPCSSLLLPCGHVVCHLCKGQIAKGGWKCPLDDMEFAEADVVPMIFKQSDLEQRCVFCIVGGQKCSFTGKLSELKEHLIECGRDEVRCAKCQLSLVRSLAVEHRQQCSSAVTAPGQTMSAAAIASAAEGLSGIRRDLEEIRERASIEKDDAETIVNTANSLAERVASLERQLVAAQKEVGAGQCNSLLSVMRKAAFTPGPHRSPSKRGNFIATCVFADVITQNAVLNGRPGYARPDNYTVSSGICTLAGYTFKLQCKFFLYSEINIKFSFCLCKGGWDYYVEWPFSKKVTLILTHPTCATKDVRLPVSMECPSAVKRPLPGTVNDGGKTSDVNWDITVLNGFVVHKGLYVNVEIE